MLEANFPLYRIIEDETRNVLVAAEDVQGFFVEQENGSSEATFLRVHQVDRNRRRAEDAILEVMNYRQEKIGEYYIGRVARREIDVERMEGELPNVSYQFFSGVCEYPRAGEVWRRWASGVHLKQDEWFQWPSKYHETWLHVVQNSWFASFRRAARYETGEVVYLDGSKVTTKSGFYCALGEAINGPGGYFGSNLDALADCLSSESGEALPLKIVWHNFQASRNSLGDNFMNSIIALIREFHIEVATD
ncbi:barstar family protein [Streptosporangium sp. NPDC002721]|uniref:barstar family protein n=1 Tax=Streptosporangium sp. NPDC002721 TaxID=3366188 RepID=UPI0036B25D7C